MNEYSKSVSDRTSWWCDEPATVVLPAAVDDVPVPADEEGEVERGPPATLPPPPPLLEASEEVPEHGQ